MEDQGPKTPGEPEDPWAAPPAPAAGSSYPAPGNPGPDSSTWSSGTPASSAGSSGYGTPAESSGYSSSAYGSSGDYSGSSAYPSGGDYSGSGAYSSSGGYPGAGSSDSAWASATTPMPQAYPGEPVPGVAPAPWPPAAPPPRRSGGLTKGGPLTIVAVALAAALVGGGIGGAVAYNAAEGDSSSAGPSSFSTPVTSSKSEAPTGSVQQVAAKVIPSVVSIDVRNAEGRIPGFTQGGGVAGSGTGVVIGKDGTILTNAHVAGDGDLSVTFSNGRTVRAKLVAQDRQTDLAVIRAEGVDDAVPISLGRSGDLTVGQTVVAIGSPLGLSGTVTTGIVSALRRPLLPQRNAGGDQESVIDGIQTDAPINPGNSGGALVDLGGNLVGITSAIATLGGGVLGGQSGSIGLGFAIPIDQAKIIAEKLARGEKVAHALLGVRVRPSDDPTQRGAYVDGLTGGGPAEKAGLRKGDVVIRLDDRLIDSSDALVAGVRSRQPGETAKLTYIRGNETKTLDVVLGSDLDEGTTS
ncbi:MAG: S1C family serine protease [Sporichthyaceae bacterium]